jgi:hypothetical protein
MHPRPNNSWLTLDGQRIVTASADKTARVSGVVTLSQIAELLAK